MLTCMADSQRLKEGRQHCLFDEVLWNWEIIADMSYPGQLNDEPTTRVKLWSSIVVLECCMMDISVRSVLYAAIVFLQVLASSL
jgi:hypothetical protein